MQPTEKTTMMFGKTPMGTIGYRAMPIGYDDFHWSLLQLCCFCYEYVCPPGTYIHFDRSVVSGQITSANELAQKMQGDWILMLDSDHTFEPDLILRMLELFEVNHLDVLCGRYHYKEPPYTPVLYQHMEGEFKNIVSWGNEKIKLLPIGAAGAGCLMIRRSVFQKLHEQFGELPFSICAPYTTDDFSFFERCRKAGIKCWSAVQVEAKHLTLRAIGLEDYNEKDAPAMIEMTAEAMA